MNDRESNMKQHQEELQQTNMCRKGNTQKTTAEEARSKRQSKLTATAKAIEDLDDREIMPQSKQPQKGQTERKRTNDQVGR